MSTIVKRLSVGAVLVALCVVSWSAWRWYDHQYPTWQEEVRLSDGRVIVVRQKHKYFDNYGTDQSWVTFTLPEMGGTQTWYSYLTPQRVDIDRGRVFVFGFPRGDKQFAYYRSPKNYMVAFVWTDGEFKRIPFVDVPEHLRQDENVHSCVPARKRELLTLVDKAAAQWCPIRGDRWKFERRINLADYQALARFYAGLDNAQPASD